MRNNRTGKRGALVSMQNLTIAVWDPYSNNRTTFEQIGDFDAKRFFQEKNISIGTINAYDDFTKCDYVVFLESDELLRGGFFVKCVTHNLENKLILFSFEPTLHNKKRRVQNLLHYFKYVLTWNDDFIDNKRVFKFKYPVYHPSYASLPESEPGARSKLLTSISGNQRHSNPLNLYRKRREIIDFFENNANGDYEFYGKGWNKASFKNYRGTVDSKYHTFINYKFAICFENSRETGYITEKIFDCLAARTIPIYLGAPNVADYIPGNCFIDYTQFGSIQEMYDFIKNMDDNTYDGYIRNINSFLNSDLVRPFTWEAFFTGLYQVIQYDQNTPRPFELKISNYRKLCIYTNHVFKKIEKKVRNIRDDIIRRVTRRDTVN